MSRALRWLGILLLAALLWVGALLVALAVPLFAVPGMRVLRNVLVACDQMINAATLGDPDETVSSRLGKAQRSGVPCRVCDWMCTALGRLDPRHCERSIEEDEGADAAR